MTQVKLLVMQHWIELLLNEAKYENGKFSISCFLLYANVKFIEEEALFYQVPDNLGFLLTKKLCLWEC